MHGRGVADGEPVVGVDAVEIQLDGSGLQAGRGDRPFGGEAIAVHGDGNARRQQAEEAAGTPDA